MVIDCFTIAIDMSMYVSPAVACCVAIFSIGIKADIQYRYSG